MREEDKLLLLAEIIGVDTSKYVNKYIDELRSSNSFLMLCENIKKARNVYSYKAQRLINEFESIDFNKIKTLQDFFVLTMKINYLIQQSEESDYINPFFYNKEVDQIKTIGEISIVFDNKKITLNDMILDERYTSNYKIDYIKEKFLEWRKEVVENIIDQYKFIFMKEKELPVSLGMDEGEKNILWISSIYNFIMIFLPIIPSSSIRNFYQGINSNRIMLILFFISWILLFLLDTILIYLVSKNYKQNKAYKEALLSLKNIENNMNKINKKCENFYDYILSCLLKNKLLEKEISYFSIDNNIVSSIFVLTRVLNNQYKGKENESITLRFVFIILSCLLLVVFAYLIYKIGGNN